MINLTDFMQDIVKILAATRDRAEKAAIIAEFILSKLPEPVAQGVRRCVILHWFDQPLIEAMLKEYHFTQDEIKDIYEQIIALPFVEKLPWGFTLQDLTREGLLKRYASTQPSLLASSARQAAPIYETHQNNKADAEALFCYIIAGNSIASRNLIRRLTSQARERGDEQYINNLREMINEAWQIPAGLADIEALLAESTAPTSIKHSDVVESVNMRIDQDKTVVDIGLKSEGVLSTKDLAVATNIDIEESLHEMPLAMLQERCQQEIRKIRGGASANDRYCLEIFYRAIKKHDEQAWNLLVSSFRHLMMAWLYRHPDHDRALRHDSTENYVDYAFTRFWQTTTHNQALTFLSLRDALIYLKASLDGAVRDTIRIHSRPTLRLPEPEAESSFEEPAAEEEEDEGRELWEAIASLLPSDREKRVTYLLIYCGLKPREIVRRLPDEFSDVHEIYRIYRNINDRLKRNTNRLRWRLNDEEE